MSTPSKTYKTHGEAGFVLDGTAFHAQGFERSVDGPYVPTSFALALEERLDVAMEQISLLQERLEEARKGSNPLSNVSISDGVPHVKVESGTTLRINTFGGQSYIDDFELNDYGIDLDPAVSVSGLTGSDMAALLCIIHDHLYLNGWRFAIKPTHEQDQTARLVIERANPSPSSSELIDFEQVW